MAPWVATAEAQEVPVLPTLSMAAMVEDIQPTGGLLMDQNDGFLWPPKG